MLAALVTKSSLKYNKIKSNHSKAGEKLSFDYQFDTFCVRVCFKPLAFIFGTSGIRDGGGG